MRIEFHCLAQRWDCLILLTIEVIGFPFVITPIFSSSPASATSATLLDLASTTTSFTLPLLILKWDACLNSTFGLITLVNRSSIKVVTSFELASDLGIVLRISAISATMI